VGYVNRRDVFVRCGSKPASRITNRGTVEQFAVAPDGTALVLQHQFKSARKLEVLSLRNRSSAWRPSRGTFDVAESCGTVIGREWVKDHFQVRDILTDQLLDVPPYRQFACSDDRKNVLGVTGSPPHLKLGIPPKDDFGSVEADNLVQFSISAGGQNLVYVIESSNKLCTRSSSSSEPVCVEAGGFPLQGLAINNDGTLLFSSVDPYCLYDTRPIPADRCSDVYKWIPGKSEAQKLWTGSNAIWMTDAQASALEQFAMTFARAQ
jgi:hypothetical protein